MELQNKNSFVTFFYARCHITFNNLIVKFSDVHVPMCCSMVTSLVRFFGLFVVVEKAATKIK